MKDGSKVALATVEVMQRGMEGKVPPDSEPIASEAVECTQARQLLQHSGVDVEAVDMVLKSLDKCQLLVDPARPTTPAVPSILATMRRLRNASAPKRRGRWHSEWHCTLAVESGELLEPIVAE